ncbi:uncharacterized protein LOC129762951 isoform X2 [Toxorhynchites rutilus septentrionalis]|uniref:uncharacterized protein LOC129762951 isoform X2 n=1 Tax=Toxorhynchites rutilus septentrionalis TaxID=329112 RepID=UPI00247ADAD5|nr:uncharacterized protein LOC129762951 isoform X2 [Toxorhynchites rutilus septentrionalis]
MHAHILTCGAVSQKCPNSCGAHIVRKEMDRHLNRCPAGFGEWPSPSSQSPASSSPPPPLPTAPIPNGVYLSLVEQQKLRSLEQELVALRGSLNEEIRQRLELITDLGQLKKRAQLADEWTGKVGEVLNGLKKCINEESEGRRLDMERCKIDVNTMAKQTQQIESWRSELIARLDQLKEEIDRVLSMHEKYQQTARVGEKTKEAKFTRMELRLNQLQSELEDLQTKHDEGMKQLQNGERGSPFNRFQADLDEIEHKLELIDICLEDHHNRIRSLQKEPRHESPLDLSDEIGSMRLVVQELLDKQAKLDCELKGVRNTVDETEDTSEKIYKTLEKYRRETYYTKQCLDDLQVHLQHQEKLAVIQNTAGHLIWRIDQFDKRFKESQENDVMMKSPPFCNKPFGYTLQLQASLNGIGTWRGRNLIVGLIVINGYYDNLLEWPCALVGTVTLRDQPEDRTTKVVDHSRPIQARRKQQHYEKSQYIHIPHQVLRSERYIRDDCIFLEVRIDQAQW